MTDVLEMPYDYDYPVEPSSVRALARAKILQMYLDLSGSGSPPNERWANKSNAERFFFGDNKREFGYWCDAADLHPDDVRGKARDIMENGLEWRAAPGKGKHYERRKKFRENRRMRILPFQHDSMHQSA